MCAVHSWKVWEMATAKAAATCREIAIAAGGVATQVATIKKIC